MTATVAASSDLNALDRQARFVCRSYLRLIWHDEYGLSEEDVLSASYKADQIYIDNTDMTGPDCTERALDIAFSERDRLFKERKL